MCKHLSNYLSLIGIMFIAFSLSFEVVAKDELSIDIRRALVQGNIASALPRLRTQASRGNREAQSDPDEFAKTPHERRRDTDRG